MTYIVFISIFIRNVYIFKRNKSTGRFLSTDRCALGLFPSWVLTRCSWSRILDRTHFTLFPSAPCQDSWKHISQKQGLVPSQTVALLLLEVDMKKLTISDYSLMSWLHLLINNSISSKNSMYMKVGERPRTKRRLRNRAIKYEEKTFLFIYLTKTESCCSCKSLFWLMWLELLHLKTDALNRWLFS